MTEVHEIRFICDRCKEIYPAYIDATPTSETWYRKFLCRNCAKTFDLKRTLTLRFSKMKTYPLCYQKLWHKCYHCGKTMWDNKWPVRPKLFSLVVCRPCIHLLRSKHFKHTNHRYRTGENV